MTLAFKEIKKSDPLWTGPLNENFKMIFSLLYPVGSIITNASAEFNPNVAFGGTWERIKGKVIVGVDEKDPDLDTAGKIGGNKTHNHTLTNGYAKLQLTGSTLAYYGKQVPRYKAQNKEGSFSGIAAPDLDLEWGTELGGTTDGSTNLPPYETAYVWKRTA